MRQGWRVLGALALAVCVQDAPARAYINQIDGTVVPEGARMQMCLDRPMSGDGPGVLDAIADAAILPETYRPVPNAMGSFDVTFVNIGEGAGFRNSFGWFWVGEDVTNPANLHTVFGCRTYGTCDCPCETIRTITVDFDAQPGFAVGRPIGFWLRTPERLDGSREDGTFSTAGCEFNRGCDPSMPNLNDSCGGRLDTDNRIYFTSQALNDDGDFVHFLVYRSITFENTFYFGFEDLFRGGDNDFEDMLVRASGLVPLCEPRPEICNGLDDDCDGLVDEGLTRGCETLCGDGLETCSAGAWGTCSARAPSAEVCDGVDNNCNGQIDEGLSRPCSSECGAGTEICVAGSYVDCNAPTPTIEVCNGLDDDCDGLVDEGLTRGCGSICGSGVEMCAAGAWVGCTAPTPTTEICNGLDDDCDGLVDEGLTRACSSACGAGLESCNAGAWVGCSAPRPSVEICNGLDDDCDGLVDEGLTRGCSTACGVGAEVCTDGAWGACDAPLPAAEVCNNLDDDCNGIIDDGNPGGGAECIPDGAGGYIVNPPDGAICFPGRVTCVAGTLQCLGAVGATREICNCEDDDCDGEVDEDVDCGAGACINCRCLTPCAEGEFPCPPGRLCDPSLAPPDGGVPGYCVSGMCDGVVCADDETCEPTTGECRNLCEGVSCAPNFACVRGRCVEDNCYGRGCPSGQRCRQSACEPDPCAGVGCPDGQYCAEGTCVAPCDLSCPAGERCEAGACVPSPCEGRCASTQSCVDGECVAPRCAPACGARRVCRGDVCVDDPCAGRRCPTDTLCRADDGVCVPSELVAPPERVLGLASGGGGCACDAAGAPSRGSAGGPLVALALLGLVLWRRRRAERARLAALATFALALPLSGCDVNPFCFENCGEEVIVDAGPPDARADARPPDGCIPIGEELCNGRDDDCDGLVDEDFDLEGDPRNCGTCGSECVLPGAFPGCVAGECTVDECEVGFHDLDGNPVNGCEYECQNTGPEICDERDNDCDGAVDEGFDLATDLANCGRCGNTCVYANASAQCVAGECGLDACNPGFVDLDGDPDNGCEYRCSGMIGATETCNGLDDDCDGRIDEGFDLMTSPLHCGACNRACAFANATSSCVAGVCGIAACAPGFRDLDGDPLTGCEYACTPTGMPDRCNGVDDDCDGRVDEDDPAVGTTCGTSVGVCSPGVTTCQRGALVCVGGSGPLPELCNGLDDDCDGTPDNGALPGVGDRCGATNVGRCEYGMLVCSGAAGLTCGGTFVGPIGEVCNGVDDDCNGAADDGLVPPAPGAVPSCANQTGVCAGRVPSCRGAAGWGCDLPPTYQTTEFRCDGLDNDCDGSVDEGCLAPIGGDVRLDTHTSPSQLNSLRPVIATGAGDLVYAAWMETTRDGSTSRPRVMFARSTNGGGTWSAPTRLDTTSGPVFNPQLAPTGATNVTSVWSDFRGGTSYREIFASRSTDSGASFPATNTKVNASGPTATTDSFGVHLAVSGSNVYVVYESFETFRRRQVWFSRSTNDGGTWSTPIQLSPATMASDYVAATPRVAASGTRVHVVWRDNRSGGTDIYVRSSTNAGSGFGAEQRIDRGDLPGQFASFDPAIAANDDNVYVIWVDNRDAGSLDIWMNRSINAGGAWLGTAVKLDQDPLPNDSIQPRIVALSGGRAIAAWVDYRSGFPDIYTTRTTTAGMTFAAPVRIDTGSPAGASASLAVALAARGELVGAAWSDDRNGFTDIYANFSLDGGATWQPQDYRMDSNGLGATDSFQPEVAVGAGRVHVIWTDHRRGSDCPFAGSVTCPNADIFYRRLASP